MSELKRTKSSCRSMISRCKAKKGTRHHKYYGHVSVCDRWLSFDAFVEDMGMRPEGKTIDRKDGNGNYEPGNCRWATPKEQVHNSSAIKLTDDDVKLVFVLAEMYTHQEVAYQFGVARSTVTRILLGERRTSVM